MTTVHDWHPSETSLAAYASGTSTPVQADSVEAHLLSCAACRSSLSRLAPTGGDAGWDRVADRIDRTSRSGRVEAWWLRVTLGSPLLCAATLAVVAALVALPLVVAAVDANGGVATFLALAPLAPLAGAVLAFRPEVDPAGAMAAATPRSGARMVLVRAAVVGAASIPAALLVAAVLPAPLELLLGWILPGLGLSLLVLGVGTRVDPSRTAAALALAWATAVALSAVGLRRLPLESMLEQLVVNHAATQVAALAAALAGAALVATRHDHTWSTT